MTIDLSQEAILVKPTFHSWTGNKSLDNEMAEAYTGRSDVDKNAIRHTKKLLSKSENAMLCRNIIRQAAKFHRDNTVPWSWDGWGMLPRKNVEHYQGTMRDFQENKLYHAASLLFETFHQDVEADRDVLGPLFRYEDYIVPEQVFDKFKIDVQYEPIVNLNAIQLDVIGDHVAVAVEQTRARHESAILAATSQLRDRIERILSDTVQRLEGMTDKSKKPEALLRSIQELAEVLPRLNISGDQGINDAAEQLRTRILSFTPEDLRDNDEVRMMVIDSAREITGAIGRRIRLPNKDDNKEE